MTDPLIYDDLPLFGFVRSREVDPHTSAEAADRVDEFAHVHFGIILKVLRSGPGTIYDIGARAGLTHVQVTRRMPEMEAHGWVFTDGVALGPTGRNCRVWRRS
jgi:predicted ArsR family transcriptional regulator